MDKAWIFFIVIIILAICLITPIVAVIRKLQELREAQHLIVELEERVHQKEYHVHDVTEEDVKRFGNRMELMNHLPFLRHKLFVLQDLIPKFFLLVLTLQFLTLFLLAYLYFRLFDT